MVAQKHDHGSKHLPQNFFSFHQCQFKVDLSDTWGGGVRGGGGGGCAI